METRRELLNEIGLEDSIVFENPSYDTAIIGYDDATSRIIYDYELMAEYLMENDGMTYEEAVEFIDYNTLRAMPYYPNGPIVMRGLSDYFDWSEFDKEAKTEYKFDASDFVNKCIAWIRNWFDINGKGCKAVIGISGGKDSTVAAALCAKALGPENVIGVAMPDNGQSINDADKICKYLGIRYICAPISSMTHAFHNMWQEFNDEDFEWSKQSSQNIPPRIRMTMLYALSQTYNGRVVGTCNSSELYIGYATRYGDLASDFEPLGDITCRRVIEVGHYLGLPKEWVDKTPDDGLPNSEPDDDKFAKWGFSYKTLDDFIEKGSSGDAIVDNAIIKMHIQTKFKLGIGEIFAY